MKVLKFGGTSVGSAERMKKLVEIIQSDEQKIVVLSAMSGTTDRLVEINEVAIDISFKYPVTNLFKKYFVSFIKYIINMADAPSYVIL